MDFLILDEEQGDSNEGSTEPLTVGADADEAVRTSTPKLCIEESSKGDDKCAEDGDDVCAATVSCSEDGAKEAADVKAVESDEKQGGIVVIQAEEPGKSEEEPEKCADEMLEEVEEVLKDVEAVVEEPPAQVAEGSAQAEKSLDSSDDVQVVAIEQPEFGKQEVTEEDKELDSSSKENKMPVSNGAGIAVSVSCFKDEDPDDPDPTESNADDVDSKPPKRSASSHGILADLKRALNMIDAEAGNPKRFKLDMNEDGNELEQEDSADPPAALSTAASASAQSVGLPVGPNLVVLSRKQLEQYVARRVRECLVTQATALLQPMEKKCDTLHRALERWRRRSFQLQKQLNEFVCEQEKCANARRSRRSVGVCVRMPPLKPPVQTPGAPGIKTIPTTVTAPTSVVSRAPSVTVNRGPNTTISTVASSGTSPAHPATPAQQIRVTGTNASMLAAVSLQSAPTSSTPVSSVPVPMQLIANTANMTASQSPGMKLPTTASSTGTPVRAVAVVSSASSSTSSAPGVKIIDLTQEEEAANAQAKALSAAGGISLGTALHKITVSSSSIPVLSAAPTSLVQVPSASNPSTSRVSIAGTSVVLSHMTGGIVTQAGANAVRLSSSSLVGPPTRVTYLVPSLPPGMVVTPREAGPRLATGSGPQPMQTILLRMATPPGGFTTVPGGAIAMPTGLLPANASGGPAGTPSGATTMMVATAAGSQVRMVRAPPPMTLPRGGTTLTLPPGTTLVRAPLASSMRPGVPQQMSVVRPPAPTASTAATTSNLSLPPKPTLQVQVPGAPVRLPPPSQPSLQVQVPGSSTTVQPAKPDAPVSIIKAGAQQPHPASLPPTPRYIDDPKKKRLPPKPALKITKAASGEKGLVLSWNMTFNSLYADIQTYQLYAYQETNSPPATSHWKKVGDVRALPLPMACTLTQFIEGHKYHFAVRAVDVHNRLGPFSDPSSILL
uniref:Putative activating transcription factor 7 n=1 Tax=Rhipicephalus pulchellus TaxID=72859 RepID=L7LXC0_RHIPC